MSKRNTNVSKKHICLSKGYVFMSQLRNLRGERTEPQFNNAKLNEENSKGKEKEKKYKVKKKKSVYNSKQLQLALLLSG